jgi:hypothetical protein
MNSLESPHIESVIPIRPIGINEHQKGQSNPEWKKDPCPIDINPGTGLQFDGKENKEEQQASTSTLYPTSTTPESIS